MPAKSKLTSTFEAQRPRLFSIAYRMLGSASDAEDVLQDAWMRLTGSEAEVRSPQAFAATIVTRLCLDRLKSARARREEYVGPWLPEPVLTGGEEGPDVLAERSESVTLAFLVLLETLSPEERAVFLLKEVYDYEHAEIAEILGTSAANSRQLFHRAKSKIRPTGVEGRVERGERRAVAERFARAFTSGDAARVADLLAADVTFVSDGGGKATAVRRPLAGREKVAALLAGLVRSARASGTASRAALDVVEVNSEPAMVLRVDGRLDGVFVFSVASRTITGIRVVRNPDKLAYLERQLSARRR
ncbi:MAG: RNA polymerase sigma-70 factor [Betaproteobacteria bacterium]